MIDEAGFDFFSTVFVLGSASDSRGASKQRKMERRSFISLFVLTTFLSASTVIFEFLIL